MKYLLIVFLFISGCAAAKGGNQAVDITGGSTTQPVNIKQTSGAVAVDVETPTANFHANLQGVHSVEGNTTNINFNSGWVSMAMGGTILLFALCLVIHAYHTKDKRVKDSPTTKLREYLNGDQT